MERIVTSDFEISMEWQGDGVDRRQVTWVRPVRSLLEIDLLGCNNGG